METVSRDEFIKLIQGIVETHLPDEVLVFEARGEVIIDRTLSGQPALPQTFVGAELKAIDPASITMIVQLAGLVKAAFEIIKLVIEIRKAKNATPPSGVDDIADKWEERLIKEGFQPDLAKKIATDFTAELASLAKP